ncbi:response regulator [Patescibacteria group bacterium]|nr:response regulator [Patescibacteria group bacterium]MBU1682309.1 response regulator [Patescibacteria group bacterium]MBU1935043.1 response regulator [Patescibacteria group bacterium]
MPKKNKILIAEDDPYLSKIMSATLKEEEFEVEMAKDGVEALKKIKKDDYALVLLDLIMPIKDGFEVLKELKKAKIKTPVLVFSNLSQERDETQVFALGAKEYFIKSDMSIEDVVKTVKRYTTKK